MIDFSTMATGEIGTAVRYSDLYASAMASQFTGAVVVSVLDKTRVTFFRAGNPICVAAIGEPDHLIGAILIELGKCVDAAVDAAAAVQEQLPPAERPLLGQLLAQHGDADDASVREAMLLQTTRRISDLFATVEGSWQAAPGDNDRTQLIGVPMAGWPLMLPSLKNYACDDELRDVQDALLGKAVQYKGAALDLKMLGFDDEDRNLLELISKPRKPDQLERALKDRRQVRAVLKLLGICGNLELLSSKAGVPIPSTIRVPKPSKAPGSGSMIDAIAPPSPSSGEHDVPVPPPMPTTLAPKRSVVESLLLKELRDLHKKLRDLDFFELLDVSHDTSAREIRMRYTALAKKFHPDALGPGQTEEVVQMARSVSAALNDAYQTLDNPETKKEYLAKLTAKSGGKVPQNDAQVEAARVKFEMGNILFKKGDFKRARDYFHFAMANDANNGLYKALYAWSIFADRRYHRADAIETSAQLISSAARMCPDDVQVQFYAGKIFRAKGDDKRAAEALHRVLELEENHDGARAEIRQMKSEGKSVDDRPARSAPARKGPPQKKKKKKKNPYEKVSAAEKLKSLFSKD